MNEVVAGRYKMHFEVKKYFTLGLHDTFYPFIEVSEPLAFGALCIMYSRLCCIK